MVYDNGRKLNVKLKNKLFIEAFLDFAFNTVSDPGIGSETPSPAVVLATTLPTRQAFTNDLKM